MAWPVALVALEQVIVMKPSDPTKGVRCPECKRVCFAWRDECPRCHHPFVEAGKDADMLERFRGAAVSANPQMPHVCIVRGPWFDDQGHEQAERVNGHVFCPRCEIAVPFFEQPEAWIDQNGEWRATEWGPGTAECPECGCVFVDTFDGCFELRLPGV